MTDTSADLVTKIDVLPDLDGLNSFDAAIDKAIGKVNQLDAAIKRVNNLKPASPYAPSGTSSAPTAGTTAAITAIAATGANLISRTPLADTVRKEAQKVARAATRGIGNGVFNALPCTDRTFAGGGMALPAPSGKPAALRGHCLPQSLLQPCTDMDLRPCLHLHLHLQPCPLLFDRLLVLVVGVSESRHP